MSQLQSQPQPTDTQLITALLETERRTLTNALSAIIEGALAQVTPATGQAILARALQNIAKQQPDPTAFRHHLSTILQ